jgi:hypothetical protein
MVKSVCRDVTTWSLLPDVFSSMSETDKQARYQGGILNCIKHGSGSYIYPGEVFQYDGEWFDKYVYTAFFYFFTGRMA